MGKERCGMACDQRFDKGRELFKKKLCALIDAADEINCDSWSFVSYTGVGINIDIKLQDGFAVGGGFSADLPNVVRLPSEQDKE